MSESKKTTSVNREVSLLGLLPTNKFGPPTLVLDTDDDQAVQSKCSL